MTVPTTNKPKAARPPDLRKVTLPFMGQWKAVTIPVAGLFSDEKCNGAVAELSQSNFRQDSCGLIISLFVRIEALLLR